MAKTYHRENLKQDLLGEALHVIRTSGAHSLSLRELARRLNVSHMAPYRHFRDKEDLLAQIIAEGFFILRQGFDRAATESKSLEDKFARMGRAYLEFCERHPDHARLMFGGFVADFSQHPECLRSGESAYQALLNMVIEMQQAGMARSGDPVPIANLIWSTVHGFSMLWIERQFASAEMVHEELGPSNQSGPSKSKNGKNKPSGEKILQHQNEQKRLMLDLMAQVLLQGLKT